MRILNYSFAERTTKCAMRFSCRMLLFCCILVMLNGGITAAYSENEEANVSLIAEVIPVVTPYHMPVEYRVIAEGPSTLELQLERLPSTLSGLEIEFLGQSIDELRLGRYRITQRYLIDPMSTATYQLPSALVQWGDSQSLQIPGRSEEPHV